MSDNDTAIQEIELAPLVEQFRPTGSPEFADRPIVATEMVEADDELLGTSMVEETFNHRSIVGEVIRIVRVSDVLMMEDPPFDDPEFINIGLIMKDSKKNTPVYREFSIYGNLKNNLKARMFTGVKPPVRTPDLFLETPHMAMVGTAPTGDGNECYYFTTPDKS